VAFRNAGLQKPSFTAALLIVPAQAPKSAMDIEREQEAKLAKKYGGLAKKKIMPKARTPAHYPWLC